MSEGDTDFTRKKLRLTLKPQQTKDVRFILSDDQRHHCLCQVIVVETARVLYSANVRYLDPSENGIVSDAQTTFKKFSTLLTGTTSFCSTFPHHEQLPNTEPAWLTVSFHNPFKYVTSTVEYYSESAEKNHTDFVRDWVRQIKVPQVYDELMFQYKQPVSDLNQSAIGVMMPMAATRNWIRMLKLSRAAGEVIGASVGTVGTFLAVQALMNANALNTLQQNQASTKRSVLSLMKRAGFFFVSAMGGIGGFVGGRALVEHLTLMLSRK